MVSTLTLECLERMPLERKFLSTMPSPIVEPRSLESVVATECSLQSMTIDTHARIKARGAGGDGARTVFAAGGLLAAFGVASCCALPVALSMLGISAASLGGIGYAAAAYQRERFCAACWCLAAVAVLSVRRWQARTRGFCALPRTRFQTLAGGVTLISVASAMALIALTFWIEGPI